MNLLLLTADDFINEHEVIISDRRLQHLQQVHQAQIGDQLRAGKLNGLQGTAMLTQLSSTQARFTVNLNQPSPAKLPLTLILALPRPKMLKRTLQTVASMGVAHLVLVNSYRVEKSFWQTPFLQEQAIYEQLVLGLEQARDTYLPKVSIEKRFKPFVQDRLPELSQNTRKLVAHPGDFAECPRALNEPVTLAIGPEGGWIPYEVELLQQAAFEPIQLGPRILRVETAVPVLLARLF
ncbi:16S rRNA (uracil(1498)-N(3))-methyltransferase [Pseudomonas sp. F1_0610]|uniref:16S rRNA (uracil(1498)-N(3))-methyltransferase n=1 Tax=Pseudomonas sp. F1_0610 TaxID=3114284 RepID=UPI0039C22A30